MTKYLPVLFFLIVITFSSCYPTIYFPDRVNTPGFAHRGEAKAVIGFKVQPSDSATGNVIAPVFDAAYAVANHVGVMVSYRSLVNKYVDESRTYGYFKNKKSFGGIYNSHYFEGGFGYFTTMGKVGRFEAYGGVGAGSISRRGNYAPQYDFNSDYYKIFLQPAIHIAPDKGRRFKVGGGFRLTMVNYYRFIATNPDTKYYVIDSDPASKYKTTVTDKPFTLFEPFINLEVGYKFVKFNLQLCGNSGVNDGARYIGSSPALSLGLVFHYAKEYFR